jgi:hypothetical protein
MTWNTIRDMLLGSKDDMISNYCSPLTLERLSGCVNFNYFKEIVFHITEILPDAPHDSPGWNAGPYPIIVIGSSQKNALGIKVMSPRFGLCLIEGEIKIWAADNLLSKLKPHAKNEDWITWRRTKNFYGEYCSGNALELLKKKEIFYVLENEVKNESIKKLMVLQGDYKLEIPLLYPLAIHMANRAENYRQKGALPMPQPMGELPDSLLESNVADKVAYLSSNFTVNMSVEPHEAPTQLLDELVNRIVIAEGPIHRDLVARRVSAAFGKARTGERIQSASDQALTRAVQSAVVVMDGDFAMTEAQRTKCPVRDRSGDNAPANAELLPPVEIRAAAARVIAESGVMPIEGLIVATARLLGFARTGNDLRDRIDGAIRSETA